MFEIGSNVVFGSHGICRVEDIKTGIEFGMPKSREKSGLMYYKLAPLFVTAYNVIYTPVENSRQLRKAVDKTEAERCLREMALFDPEVFYDNSQGRLKEHYKAIIADDMPSSYLRLIKEIHKKRDTAMARHKRLGQVDENYLKKAESTVSRELAAALGTTPELIKLRIYEELRSRGNKD